MHDDIPGLDSGSESAPGESSTKPREPGVVGPESENRGGPEAPEDSLNDRPSTAMPPNTSLGQSAALPAGSLPGPYLAPQGDENRTPPANAPSRVNPAVTVENTRPDAPDQVR